MGFPIYALIEDKGKNGIQIGLPFVLRKKLDLHHIDVTEGVENASYPYFEIKLISNQDNTVSNESVIYAIKASLNEKNENYSCFFRLCEDALIISSEGYFLTNEQKQEFLNDFVDAFSDVVNLHQDYKTKLIDTIKNRFKSVFPESEVKSDTSNIEVLSSAFGLFVIDKGPAPAAEGPRLVGPSQ